MEVVTHARMRDVAIDAAMIAMHDLIDRGPTPAMLAAWVSGMTLTEWWHAAWKAELDQ